MIYFEPVNLKQWNMLEKVTGIWYEDAFLATQEMLKGDLVLFHVGQQDKTVKSGIYGYGTIIKAPFILEDHPDYYCNGRLTVIVRFDRLDYYTPIIPHEECKEFCRQFRTVHKIDPVYYDDIKERLNL